MHHKVLIWITAWESLEGLQLLSDCELEQEKHIRLNHWNLTIFICSLLSPILDSSGVPSQVLGFTSVTTWTYIKFIYHLPEIIIMAKEELAHWLFKVCVTCAILELDMGTAAKQMDWYWGKILITKKSWNLFVFFLSFKWRRQRKTK